MKHILFIISILFLSTIAFSQNEMENIGIGSGKSKNTQYIAISYNGKGLLSTNKQTLRGKQKGNYLDYPLSELLDSIDSNHTFVNLGKHWFNGNLIANGNYTHQARGYTSTVVNSGKWDITVGTGVVRSSQFRMDSSLIHLETTGGLNDINLLASDDIFLSAGYSDPGATSTIGLYSDKISLATSGIIAAGATIELDTIGTVTIESGDDVFVDADGQIDVDAEQSISIQAHGTAAGVFLNSDDGNTSQLGLVNGGANLQSSTETFIGSTSTVSFDATTYKFYTLPPTYADDTAAGVGGLTQGELYITATGQLMIKL